MASCPRGSPRIILPATLVLPGSRINRLAIPFLGKAGNRLSGSRVEASGLLELQPTEVIDVWIPLLMFSVLFGLSMDYLTVMYVDSDLTHGAKLNFSRKERRGEQQSLLSSKHFTPHHAASGRGRCDDADSYL